MKPGTQPAMTEHRARVDGTAQERVAAVLASVMYEADPIADDLDDADRLLAADPHLAQDIEDGAALRRLREALPGDWYVMVTAGRSVVWSVSVFEERGNAVLGRDADTIAQAADACREAIEAQR